MATKSRSLFLRGYGPPRSDWGLQRSVEEDLLEWSRMDRQEAEEWREWNAVNLARHKAVCSSYRAFLDRTRLVEKEVLSPSNVKEVEELELVE